MFELVMIALTSTVVAIFAVWLFRKLTQSRGASSASLSASRIPTDVAQRPRHRNLDGAVGGRRASRKPRGGGDIKPWGW